MATRIGIAGITGRMGHLLAEETRAAGATWPAASTAPIGGTSRGGTLPRHRRPRRRLATW